MSRVSDDRSTRPRRTVQLWPLLSLLLALVLLPATALSQQPLAPQEETWDSLAVHGRGDFQAGDASNLAAGEVLSLGGDDSFVPRGDTPFRIFGVYTSPVIPANRPFDAIRLGFQASVPAGTAVSAEVRVQSSGNRWSPWQEIGPDRESFAVPVPGVSAQYRLTLLSEQAGTSPSVREVRLEVRPSDPSAPAGDFQALVTRPTVRLYATRQGLVGGVTANGHRIVERDRFAALPSKRALNPRDGRDYQLEVSYKDKKATVPVWDVGPWNIKDNFWESPREMWNDLPRFTPQAQAAFFDNYNDGRDQFGRLILYPASVDLADGTFWDDLGMKGSDWVDVTFLWVDAAAPPLVPMPVVVPKSGPIPQPIGSRAGTAPAPTAPPTPTPLPKTWYFAEGSTGKPFDTWLLLQNPDPDPATAKVTYMLPNGGQKVASYGLKPASRTSIFLNSVVPDTEVSTLVESDRYILAERAMYFGQEGHVTTGVISPSTTWYFAEGNTVPPFETWVLLQNPNTEPAVATLTFFKDDGSTITHKMLIPHVSRTSLLVNLVVPDSSVGIKVEADRPIVAERSVYKDKGRTGSGSMGATQLSTTWYLAEGNTRQGYDTWILLLNPNDQPTTATVTYMKEDGSTVVKRYPVPARCRVSVYVNVEVPGARLGAKIETDLPIVAERSFYFSGGMGSHNSVAAPAPSKRWSLPEGSTAQPFVQNLHLLNPNGVPANVTATFMKEDGTTVEKKYTMKATSRLTLEMNSILPDTAFSTRIDSDQPVVAERSMYFHDWKGGHNSMGIPR